VTAQKGDTSKACVATLLAEARALGVERLDAIALLSHQTQRARTWLLAHDDEPLDSAVIDGVRDALRQRGGGVPRAYLVGHKEFHGLRLSVNRSVLIPRPETEGLVDDALAWLAARDDLAPTVVVDLGTGSGAIALALKHRHPRARIHGVDQSLAALETAHANARALGLDVTWHLGDWWRGGWLDDVTQDGEIKLVVANPPYIANGDPHLAALRHEPVAALVSGQDGLDAIRSIVGDAAAHLHTDFALMLEHGHDQGVAVRQLMTQSGFDSTTTRTDLAGTPRWTLGTRSVARSHPS
jgi:release factor glutamine methyltransferase